MNESMPLKNPSPQPDPFIGELVLLTFFYGLLMGPLYSAVTVRWAFSVLSDTSIALEALLLLIASLLNLSQLPIAYGLYRKQRWAALAAYRTSAVLIVLSMLSLPLSMMQGQGDYVFTVFPFGFGLWVQSLLKSSEEAQELLQRKD